MSRLIKKIKSEAFFIYKLLNPKYTPVCAGDFRCYVNYFKNRFLGTDLLKKFPGFKFEGNDNFEIHSLCQKSDIWILACSLYSFLHFSGLNPSAIIIHDDGSLDDNDKRVLVSKFSNLQVISRETADEKIVNLLESERAKLYRKNGHPLILKLVDIFILSSAPKVMILDSDVLFFKQPGEIIQFVKSSSGLDALISGFPESLDKFQILVNNKYLKSRDLVNKRVEYMNSGIILYNKSSLTADMLYEYFDNCSMNYHDYFVEMTGWNCLISQLNYDFLPLDQYIIKGRVSDTTVTKHYTSGRRQELYAHGIALLRKCLKK